MSFYQGKGVMQAAILTHAFIYSIVPPKSEKQDQKKRRPYQHTSAAPQPQELLRPKQRTSALFQPRRSSANIVGKKHSSDAAPTDTPQCIPAPSCLFKRERKTRENDRLSTQAREAERRRKQIC